MVSPWNWVSVQESEETRMMLLPDGRKSFKISVAVVDTIPAVTDRQTPSQPASHVAVVKTPLTSRGKNIKFS